MFQIWRQPPRNGELGPCGNEPYPPHLVETYVPVIDVDLTYNPTISGHTSQQLHCNKQSSTEFIGFLSEEILNVEVYYIPCWSDRIWMYVYIPHVCLYGTVIELLQVPSFLV